VFAGEGAYWSERAEVDEHLGDLGGALAAVEQMQRRFGPRADARNELANRPIVELRL